MKDLESTFFYAILLSFSLAILLNGPAFTGLVTGSSQTEIIQINQIYSENTNISFTLKGNITSLKVSGEFIGNGSGIIKFEDYVVVNNEYLNRETGNLITGFVVQDIENEIVAIEENKEEIIIPNEITEEEITNEIIQNVSEEVVVIEEGTTVEQTPIIEETEILEEEITNNETIINNESEEIFNDDIELDDSDEINISNGFENIVELNNSLNVSEDISANISENITVIIVNETIEINESLTNFTNTSIQEQTENIAITGFENYCLETCLISGNKEIVLIIELDNVLLNLTSITYSYKLSEDEIIDEIILPVINSTINQTTNISINYTINQTNITTNLSLNISTNLTNISLNMSLINFTNLTGLNLTNISLINLTNISLINITNVSLVNITNITLVNITNITSLNLTDIEIFNLNLDLFELLYYEPGYTKLKYENNFLTIKAQNISLVKTKIYELDDERITSLAFFVNNTESTEFNVESESADIILKCVQFTNNACKKWQELNNSFVFFNKTTTFTIFEDGIYSVGKITPRTVTKIPTNSVYYNSDCEYCLEKYVCDAQIFCVMENAIELKTSFIAKLDFDIFGLNKSWYKSEVCAHKSYSTEDVVNYIKYSPESFCSDINNGNSTSDLISYALLEKDSQIDCIDASEILRFAQDQGHSNVFIDWIGQDLNGASYPFNCYFGMDNDTCTNMTDGGCLPYLKLSYR